MLSQPAVASATCDHPLFCLCRRQTCCGARLDSIDFFNLTSGHRYRLSSIASGSVISLLTGEKQSMPCFSLVLCCALQVYATQQVSLMALNWKGINRESRNCAVCLSISSSFELSIQIRLSLVVLLSRLGKKFVSWFAIGGRQMHVQA